MSAPNLDPQMMEVINQMMSGQQSTYVPEVPVAGAAGDSRSFWDKLQMIATQGDPNSTQPTPESLGRHKQFFGGLGQIAQGLGGMFGGGGPITSLPIPYQGATPSLGADNGAGMQALVAQLLGGR